MNRIATQSSPTPKGEGKQRRMTARAAIASLAGTTIEGFDFLAYGTAAALVFNQLFFPNFDPTTGTLAAFGSFAAGFFARPLGGIIFGHFGDKLGRKKMLTLSLMLMGGATVLVGLLPTYNQIGVWAAILLVMLRVIQGFAFGGELAGAMLMAVEHAPSHRKGFFGSLPQMGSPLGLLLSAGAFALVTQLPESDFLSWGWRLPFVFSLLLIAIGLFIRYKVDESPEFTKIKAQGKTTTLPAKDVLKNHWKPLLLTMGGKLGEVTLYFTIVVFALSYATKQLGFTRQDALMAIVIGAAIQTLSIPFFGWLGDKIGTRRLYVIGGLLLAVMAVPLLKAIGSGSYPAYVIAVVLGLALNYAIMFGPQSILYAAQFPPELRYSGMSLGIQLAAAIGGGLAPIIATSLTQSSGNLAAMGYYLAALGLIAALCASLMRSPNRPGERA